MVKPVRIISSMCSLVTNYIIHIYIHYYILILYYITVRPVLLLFVYTEKNYIVRHIGSVFDTTWQRIIDFVTSEDRECGTRGEDSYLSSTRHVLAPSYVSLLGNRAGSQPLHDNSDPHTYFAIFSRPSRLPLSSLALHGRATNLPTPLPKTTAFAYVTGVRRRRRASRKQAPPRAPRRRAVFRPVPNQLDKHACGLRFLPTLLLERERERR